MVASFRLLVSDSLQQIISGCPMSPDPCSKSGDFKKGKKEDNVCILGGMNDPFKMANTHTHTHPAGLMWRPQRNLCVKRHLGHTTVRRSGQ